MTGKEGNSPKYIVLKRQIEQWIENGKVGIDQQLPSEHELAGLFGYSRQTVRQAVKTLVNEGRLYSLQGKGTFVRAAVLSPPPVGLLTTFISDYIFPSIIEGVETVFRQNGYQLMLSGTGHDKAKEQECLRMLLSAPVSGLLIEPTKSAEPNVNREQYGQLIARGIPFIMLHAKYAGLPCPCVQMDDEQAGFIAAEHLLEQGHRIIAGLFKTDDVQGIGRMNGFIRAHRRRGLQPAASCIVGYSTGQREHRPQEAAEQLLQLPQGRRPTAFVCYNDEIAVQLLEVFRHRSLRVPDDVSIIGFDDSSLATATEVKLTTIVHPKAQMGEMAARLLLARIRQPQAEWSSTDVVYPPELRIRESTKPIDL